MSNQHDLQLILRSHAPIIVVATHEEERALRLLQAAAAGSNRDITKWTITTGLENSAAPTLQLQDLHTESPTTEPPAALQRIKNQKRPGIFALLDFHPYLSEPLIIRLLKEIALSAPVTGHVVVLISHHIDLPDELSRFSAHFELSMPDEAALRQMLMDESKIWVMKNKGDKISADATAIDLLVRNLLGLTHTDAARLIRNAIHDDGAITHADVPRVQATKYQLIGQDGV
ncbi:MAG: ATPase AAA, partial [Halothiobacillaceae bacterium]